MTNENEILQRIREKIGLDMTRSGDFEVLSQAIRDTTNENLGVNTLKRLFGFKMDKTVPRLSTLDIIARFLGCDNYDSLAKELGEDADISVFTPIEAIDVQSLQPGTQVRTVYEPNRVFTMTYISESRFIVNDVKGSKNILKGDILTGILFKRIEFDTFKILNFLIALPFFFNQFLIFHLILYQPRNIFRRGASPRLPIL